MFNQKSLLALLLCGAMTFSMAGCSGGGKATTASANSQSGSSAAAGKAKYVMKIGHNQPTDNPRHVSLLAFKKEVEEKTNGGISVEIYPSGQLGTEKETQEAVKMGTVQGFRGGQFDFAPKLTIFTLPFLCDNNKQIHALINSDFGEVKNGAECKRPKVPVKRRGLLRPADTWWVISPGG
jgi:C4-dicarboxylate-binding protein DctP